MVHLAKFVKSISHRRLLHQSNQSMGAFMGKASTDSTGGPDADRQEGCVFCNIVDGKDQKTTLLYQDEEYAVFPDIHPAATHHYLIVPKKHFKNVKSLTYCDIPLLNRLVEIGKQVLEQRGGSMDSSRMGFHWPPFTSISHLHLHVIAPTAEMSTLGRIIFRPGSAWFSTVEDTVAYLERTRPPS